ncbi:bifunctional NADP phosphatase/NAD kinase [Methanocaldococcus infernus]
MVMEALKIALEVVNEVHKKIKPLIGWEKAGETVKIGADGTPTKRIDVVAEETAIEVLEKYGGILVSEEVGTLNLGEGEYIYVLDPIDGTYNAIKDIPFYASSIAIGYRDAKTIDDLFLGVVKNLVTGDIYYGIKGEGSYLVKENGKKKKLEVNKKSELREISISAYGLSRESLELLKNIRVRLFGATALEMCFTVSGALDAYINLNKNARLVDIAGAYIICKEGNAVITDVNGKPLNMKMDVREKSTIVLANPILHRKFVSILGNKWILKPIAFGVVVKDNKEAIELAKKAINYLKSKNIPVYCDKFLKSIVNEKEIDKKKISHVIAIGGDGTILKAARIVNNEPIPILAINLGRVGFLADFSKEELFKAIDLVISGNYDVIKREKISCKVKRRRYNALNEVVIITKNPAKILEFSLYINNKKVEEIRADGLIISTPTGSTAYSLSAGGPIVDNSVSCFIITPICPFKLSSRPLVVGSQNKVEIELNSDKRALVVIDGSVEEEIKKGERVEIEKDGYSYFVKGKDFYEKLKEFTKMV